MQEHFKNCQTLQPGNAPLACDCGSDLIHQQEELINEIQANLKAVVRAYRELVIKYDKLEQRCVK